MKLKRVLEGLAFLVSSLEVTVNMLNSESNILVVQNPADLSVRGGTNKVAVFCKRNDAGEFGIYFPGTTSLPYDGVNVITDTFGTKFINSNAQDT